MIEQLLFDASHLNEAFLVVVYTKQNQQNEFKEYLGQKRKNYFIFLPQSRIDIFVLWYPIQLEFLNFFVIL
jgi:hypothetical protein